MKNLLLLLLSLVLSMNALAQSVTNSKATSKGLFLGAGIGGGMNLIADDATSISYTRFSIPNIKIGYRINEQWTPMIYAPGGSHMIAKTERAFEAITLATQYWPLERLWINMGAGLALEATPFYLVDYAEGFPPFNTGWALTTSMGYEVFKLSQRWFVDVQIRLLYGNFSSSLDESHTAIDVIIGINRR